MPALTSFAIDTGEQYESHWRFLPEEHDDFEAAAISIAELITHGDHRLGKSTKGGAAL